jgi:DNA-binding response OmpR family regulator
MSQKPYILYLKNGHHAFLEQLRHRLTQSGYSMIGTKYNEGTLELIRKQKPDVLVLDLTKQDCENWQLFRQIKADKSLTGISIIDVSIRVAEKGRIVLGDQIQPDLERVARSIEILARKSQSVDPFYGA